MPGASDGSSLRWTGGGATTCFSGAVSVDDAAVLRRAVERDDERRRADERAEQQPVTRVVDELQVDVGVVDGRVAAERVVRDVERVVRARRDRQAGLVRGVEDGRRHLADAAAEPGRELAVDDHGRLEEALRGGALAGRLVERERRAGRDQLAVDEVRDELDVVDAVRDAAVERLVAAPTSPVMPIAFAAAVVRPTVTDVSDDREPRDPVVDSAAASTAAAVRGTSSPRPGCAGIDRRRGRRRRRSCAPWAGWPTMRSSFAKYAFGGRRRRARAAPPFARRELEHRRELPRREPGSGACRRRA